jgi:hypothetical protein
MPYVYRVGRLSRWSSIALVVYRVGRLSHWSSIELVYIGTSLFIYHVRLIGMGQIVRGSPMTHLTLLLTDDLYSTCSFCLDRHCPPAHHMAFIKLSEASSCHAQVIRASTVT